MSGKNAREPLEQRAELAADLVRDSYALFRQPAPAVKEPPLPTASVTEGEPPAEVPAETPAEVPAEAPVEVPAEAPAEVPAEAPVEVPAETPVEVPVPERVGEISAAADAPKPAKAKKYEHGRTLWEEYLHKNVRQLLVGLVIALAVGALVAVLSKLSVPLFLLLAAVTYLLSCFFEYRRYRKLFLKHLRSTYQNPKPAQKPDVTSPEFVWDIKQETLSTADYAGSAPSGAAANEQPPEE